VPHLIELPWHLAGEVVVESAGTWSPSTLQGDFTRDVERFTPASAGTILAGATSGAARIRLLFAGDGEILRATAPGLPGKGDAPFLVRRAEGKVTRMVTVIDLAAEVVDVSLSGDTISIVEPGGASTIQLLPGEAHITSGQRTVVLAGARPEARRVQPLFAEKPLVSRGNAIWVEPPPVLDGSLAGFNLSAPLRMEGEHHYLRSEEPYPGTGEFSAKVAVNWDERALYVAVDVTKPDLVVRPADAPPLLLDNEPDDIHSDGVQVYYRRNDDAVIGYLIRPGAESALQVRPIGEAAAALDQPVGGWQRTRRGYRLTFALPAAGLEAFRQQGRFTFDVVINEMHDDRVRRAGQLVWSGGHGWVYLRGDRLDPEQFGVLEFIG
jgi:hypothetical protein